MQRNGAGAVYLNVFHPDIINFLATKKENADEKVRIKTLSMGLVLPDKFYELVGNDDYMYLFSPYDVEREYGKPFSYINITEEYDNLVENKSITKSRIKARQLNDEISKLQQEAGYPYIINEDTVNLANAGAGKVIMSNLCSEILQEQVPSKLNRDLSYSEVGQDISCNLGSTVISNMMDSGKEFGDKVELMMRALTKVSMSTSIEEVPTIKKGNDLTHSVGLGAMGLHSYLADMEIMYGDEQSKDFTNMYFLLLNYYSLKASNKLSKEAGNSYYGFENSTYASGEYFDTYLANNDLAPRTERVAELFEDIHIPTVEDWRQLQQEVQAFGLFNKYRMALAPNGSIGYVAEASPSIQPIIQRVEERQEKKTGKTYYPAPKLSDRTMPYYRSAYDMSMLDMIDVYAEATKHVDQGISMSVYFAKHIKAGLYPWKTGDNEYNTRDLSLVRSYAHAKGIKSMYYTRSYSEEEGRENSINTCESCSI